MSSIQSVLGYFKATQRTIKIGLQRGWAPLEAYFWGHHQSDLPT